MPKIYRHVSNYASPYDVINTATESTLNCTKLDVCRSMVTVGSPSFFTLEQIKAYGLARAFYTAIIEKAALVINNITSDKTRLRRHPVFDSYVSDQKRIISYNLGMAFAKLYSQELLRIPNLIHVETLKKQNAVTFVAQTGAPRPREPDLVGRSPDGQWHIFEAKGVSGSPAQLSGKISDAKIQVSQVAGIQGTPPATRSACATYIGSDRILTHVSDPPSDAEKSIEVDPEKFILSYYAPYLLADELSLPSRRSLRIGRLTVEAVDLEVGNRKLTVGIETSRLDALRRKDFTMLPQDIDGRQQLEPPDAPYSLGPDGFYVSYSGSN